MTRKSVFVPVPPSLWRFPTLDHLGVTSLAGDFGAGGGSLELDPTNPSAAKVSISFNVAETILRSEFGITYAPVVGNEVELEISSCRRFCRSGLPVSGHF